MNSFCKKIAGGLGPRSSGSLGVPMRVTFNFDLINPLKPSGAKSAREPECQKLKNGGLDQYGPGRSEV